LQVAPLPLPPLPRVEITFEYTFDELHEGMTFSPEVKQRKTPAFTLGLLAWVVFIALATMLFMLLNNRATTVPQTPAPPVRVDVIVAVAPSALVASGIGLTAVLLAVATWMLTSKSERVRRSSTRVATGAVIAVVLFVVAGSLVLISNTDEVNWSVSRRQAVMLALAPWIVVSFLILALIVWLSGMNLRRQWNCKPQLRRRRTIVLDGDGEHFTDGLAEMFYRWPCFRRAWETANVLVLMDENDLRHILPKRVMDPTTLDLARAVLSNHIADCKFLTTAGGFPVAAPAAPPPAAPPPA
jgi:hypothetical protein